MPHKQIIPATAPTEDSRHNVPVELLPVTFATQPCSLVSPLPDRVVRRFSGYRLLQTQTRNDSVVFHVASTERCIAANGTSGNQSINQANLMGQIIGSEIRQSSSTVSFSGPNDWQRRHICRTLRTCYLLSILN